MEGRWERGITRRTARDSIMNLDVLSCNGFWGMYGHETSSHSRPTIQERESQSSLELPSGSRHGRSAPSQLGSDMPCLLDYRTSSLSLPIHLKSVRFRPLILLSSACLQVSASRLWDSISVASADSGPWWNWNAVETEGSTDLSLLIERRSKLC